VTASASRRPVNEAVILPDNPNRLSDREAMGLPETFVDRQPAALLAEHRALLSAKAEDLVALVEDPGQPFDRRHAAGTVLGLIGDPRVRTLDPVMQRIPAASPVLGLDPAEIARVVREWSHVRIHPDWIAKECPRHVVDLESYAIMRYPVTNSEYRTFLAESGHHRIPSSWRFGIYPAALSNHPVWGVTPEAAHAYAAWLSAATGRAFRLPTEAEWEYAASSGDGREYPWGAGFDRSRANTVESGPITTTPVGLYPHGRSPFGVDDLAGNVEECVTDEYRPYPGGQAISDDLALIRGDYRVARGGCFTRFGDLARCSRRHGCHQREIYAMGFRLVECTTVYKSYG
jgi:hypothetical protein